MSKANFLPYRSLYFADFSEFGIELKTRYLVNDSERDPAFLLNGKVGVSNFSPSDDDFSVEVTVSIRHPGLLFRELACSPSKLAVALSWSSRETSLRGVSSHFVIVDQDNPISETLRIHFESGKLIGSVCIDTIVYLIEASPNDLPGYCVTRGAILGHLSETLEICIDGDGANFPITEIEEKGAPLWILRMDWEDVEKDLFCKDHFELILNKSHKEYPEPDPDQLDKIPPALKEILTSCLYAFLVKLQQEPNSWELIISHSCPSGTIGDAAWQLIDRKGWDISNHPKLLKEIRATFGKN